jgi:hypothetical protein
MPTSNVDVGLHLCPAGLWTTIFRGALPFTGYWEVFVQPKVYVNPDVPIKYDYSAWSTHPSWSCYGTRRSSWREVIWIGWTPWAELKVKPDVDSLFSVVGY